MKRFFLVVAMGALAVATTSFGESFNNMNHGGYAPCCPPPPCQTQYPQQRPVNYGNVGGYGSGGGGFGGGYSSGGGGTIANGGGGGGFGGGYGGSQMPFSQYGQNQLFNPTFQPYLNSAPWGQYSPYTSQTQWNQPWTSNGFNGYGSTMTSPYFGNQFQQPYDNFNGGVPSMYGNSGPGGVPSMYGNGIPGMGYNVGGLGTSDFYDYGMSGQNYGMSPYLGNNDYNYSDYGVGLGYGGNFTPNPYDYSGGFNGSVGGLWGDVGFGGALSSWWN